MDNVMNHNEIAKDKRTRYTIGPQVIHRDIHNLPLTEFMKALGQEHPVAADGDLRIYNSPYDLSSKGTMVINVRTNLWRDTKSGANGGIYDLAYELTGCANKSELNRYIAGEMDFFEKQIKNNKNMAKKKTEEPAADEKQEQPKKKTTQKASKPKTDSKEETSKEESKKAKTSKKEDAKVENPVDAKIEKTEKVEKEAKQKKPPMLVTSSGDLVTHAHWYKTKSGKLFFTAKVNGVPLYSKPMDPADFADLQEKKTTLQKLFEKYYPTKVAPRFPDSDFNFKKKAKIYGTSEGQMVVTKYNVYTNKSTDSGYNIGQFMLYAEVKGPNMEKPMKMSVPASQDVLDNYFDHTRAPEKQIMMSFGDRLGLKEHYQQFKLPEGIEVKDSQVKLVKDKETNQYQLNVKGPDGVTGAHTLSYYDTKAFFDKKATKEQLVAKHFDKLNNIDWSVKQDNKQAQKQETQKSIGMK